MLENNVLLLNSIIANLLGMIWKMVSSHSLAFGFYVDFWLLNKYSCKLLSHHFQPCFLQLIKSWLSCLLVFLISYACHQNLSEDPCAILFEIFHKWNLTFSLISQIPHHKHFQPHKITVPKTKTLSPLYISSEPIRFFLISLIVILPQVSSLRYVPSYSPLK